MIPDTALHQAQYVHLKSHVWNHVSHLMELVETESILCIKD